MKSKHLVTGYIYPNFAKAQLVYSHYGFEIPAEGPHSVKNLYNIEILACRVEFKK